MSKQKIFNLDLPVAEGYLTRVHETFRPGTLIRIKESKVLYDDDRYNDPYTAIITCEVVPEQQIHSEEMRSTLEFKKEPVWSLIPMLAALCEISRGTLLRLGISLIPTMDGQELSKAQEKFLEQRKEIAEHIQHISKEKENE